jgi:ESCRT-I complex subunit VPS28
MNTWPADLYAIIKATEKLERAYVRDAIPPEAYEQACERLIAQFKVRDKDRWICCFR